MTKKLTLLLVLCFSLLGMIACDTTTTTFLTTLSTTTSESTTSLSDTTTISTSAYVYDPIAVSDAVYEEERLSFKFFWEAANGDPASPGFGLITDRYNVDTRTMSDSSIASVGYGLTAIPIGIENAWISYDEGYARTFGTLETIQGLDRTHGFWFHFLEMETGHRSGTSEVSIIDSAILLCGILFAGEYFGGVIAEMAQEIYDEVEWTWYYNATTKMFRMGYLPESGFAGNWDVYSEQMMIYVLAAGSTTYPVDHLAYTTMKSKSAVGTYGSADPFIMTYAGTLFTYQFSHSWIDFRNRSDSFGTNWFTNSVNASIAAHDYAVALGTQYKTFSDVSWGATASDGPDGYNGRYGSRPSMYNNSGHYVDGTLAPCGAVGSIAFTPELSIGAIEHYATIPALQSKYGFRDAYNLGLQPNAPAYVVRPTRLIPLSGWFDPYVLGLDKGVGLLMIENYRSGMVWEFFMRSEIVQRGMQELGINEIL